MCVEALRKLLSARLEPVLWEFVHNVITGLALCFHLSHHVKDPQRGPSDIASTYSFLDIHPSYLNLPTREELINNVYEL